MADRDAHARRRVALHRRRAGHRAWSSSGPRDRPWRSRAFFDVDGTLIARNSAPLYMRHLRRTGQARRRDVARTLYYLLRYKLGLLDIERALEESMRFVRGQREATMPRDCAAWYERDGPAVALPADGRPWSRRIGARATCGAPHERHPLPRRPARRRARHRAPPRDPARGPRRRVHRRGRAAALLRRGKVHWASSLPRPAGHRSGASYFYTDSITDLPLLEAVGQPRVVHPDPPLRRLAQHRGWPILRPRLGRQLAAAGGAHRRMRRG